MRPARVLVEALAGGGPSSLWALVAVVLWLGVLAAHPLCGWWFEDDARTSGGVYFEIRPAERAKLDR
jgi:hypothetical protein